MQFIPAYNSRIEEALGEARDIALGDTPTRVLCAEHLAAIMVQTGRTKDRQRLTLMLEQASLDPSRFESILQRHELTERFRQ